MYKSMLFSITALGMLIAGTVNAETNQGYNLCWRYCQTQASNQFSCEAYCRCVHIKHKGSLYCRIRSTVDHPDLVQGRTTSGSGSAYSVSPKAGARIR